MTTLSPDSAEVLKQLVADAGKTRVIFINGILTNASAFYDQSWIIQKTFGLARKPTPLVEFPDYYNHVGSLDFSPIHNESLLDNPIKFLIDFLKNIVGETIKEFINDSSGGLVEFGEIFSLALEFFQNPTIQKLQEEKFSADLLNLILGHIPLASNLASLVNNIPEDSDIGESLRQFWFSDTSPIQI
jgi:hypothetical protein